MQRWHVVNGDWTIPHQIEGYSADVLTEEAPCVAGCDDMCRRFHLFKRCRWNCNPMQLMEYERNIEDASHLCRQINVRFLQNTLSEPAIFEMSFFWCHVCHL
ncbi:Eukaryotic translation initiation factor 3 subunit A [Fusarium oxysporum f. sp. albedinis]|nr:Eukaryotic translation initiation factor 3 subunit A [Fusarium oxysporum f. sp. albedinis]